MSKALHLDGADLRATHYCASGNQPWRLFRALKFVCRPDNLIERIEPMSVLIHQKLGITNDVDEEDMCDPVAGSLFDLNGHDYIGVSEATIFSKRGSPRNESHAGLKRSSP
jgi:hypothetical protein